MLLSLAQWLQGLSPEFGFFRVFQYITFRAVMAAMTSMLIGLAFGPWVINRLAEMKIGGELEKVGRGVEGNLGNGLLRAESSQQQKPSYGKPSHQNLQCRTNLSQRSSPGI